MHFLFGCLFFCVFSASFGFNCFDKLLSCTGCRKHVADGCHWCKVPTAAGGGGCQFENSEQACKDADPNAAWDPECPVGEGDSRPDPTTQSGTGNDGPVNTTNSDGSTGSTGSSTGTTGSTGTSGTTGSTGSTTGATGSTDTSSTTGSTGSTTDSSGSGSTGSTTNDGSTTTNGGSTTSTNGGSTNGGSTTNGGSSSTSSGGGTCTQEYKGDTNCPDGEKWGALKATAPGNNCGYSWMDYHCTIKEQACVPKEGSSEKCMFVTCRNTPGVCERQLGPDWVCADVLLVQDPGGPTKGSCAGISLTGNHGESAAPTLAASTAVAIVAIVANALTLHA